MSGAAGTLGDTRPSGAARRLALVFLGLLALPLCGYGYLDLGSGSYVIQLVIAVFVGLSFSLKRLWGKVRARLSRKTQSVETRDVP